MPTADLVINGTVLTVDDAQPTAEALAVSDGRIVAVGKRSDVESWIGPETQTLDIGDGCVMPGLVEAHGHPLMEAIVLSDRMVDIRPVTMPKADDVVAAIRAEVAKRAADGAYLVGWDALLQTGLPDPTLAWLNEVAPDSPLVIIHNSGHKAFFNSAAAAGAGITRDTPDPKGSKYGHDADGDLDGTAEESAAVFSLLMGAIEPGDYPAMLRAELARLNRAGLTTCSEMAFDPIYRPALAQMHDELTVRLRVYEMSNPEMTTEASPVNGDDLFRQVGIKIWWDGSPWVGNIDLSFPYLDTDATRAIGVTPGSCGHANYTREQLVEIVHAYFPKGWPMSCHVQGDAGVDPILDIYEDALRAGPATTTGCGSSTSVRSATRSYSAPTTSASPAACSSTRSTIGATSSSTVFSAPSTETVGCHAVPRSPPACASRCTTTRRSPRRSRCATSASPPPAPRRAAG